MMAVANDVCGSAPPPGDISYKAKFSEIRWLTAMRRRHW
jgi:hypothetical protein